jgi:hypothetical protein
MRRGRVRAWVASESTCLSDESVRIENVAGGRTGGMGYGRRGSDGQHTRADMLGHARERATVAARDAKGMAEEAVTLSTTGSESV